VILDSLAVDASAFANRTGWVAKPEGLCKGDVCVPAPGVDRGDGTLDVRVLEERLRMPLVHDEVHGLYALGPESGGQSLTTARAPDLTLPQLDGSPFSLNSLRGRKIVMVAWASW
jgi:hypothetical protein